MGSGLQDGSGRGVVLRMRKTVFWKVALILIGVQVVTGLLAVGLGTYFAQERSLELVRGNLFLRLDQTAGEVEARAEFDEEGRMTLPRRLELDLATRFPDSTTVLELEGEAISGRQVGSLPEGALEALETGEIEVVLDGGEGTWALAPLLAPDGLPAGALFIRPLDNTLREELRGTREAFVRAVWTVAGLAALLALLLGAFFTWRLVTPLRRMTRRVESLGEGDYADRLPKAGHDELGRLSSAINDMAGRVEASIEALQSTDRLRRELVANVGHDLRTPLAALKGYLDEANRFAAEGRDDEAIEALGVAQRQSDQMARLVADLFELSKLEQASLERGSAPLQLGPVPFAELIQDAARMHRQRLTEAGIAFEVDLPATLPTIQADGARLMRVLDNLLSNALRHTPEGGTVTISGTVHNESVTIRVADTGDGIPADELDAVFERYYRGDFARTRSDDGSGSGLGLAISRAIARAHGGDLIVQSEEGKESEFEVRIPRAKQNTSLR